MTPRFSQAVDPIFSCVLNLLRQIEEGKNRFAHEERQRILSLIDQAEAIVGSGREWELAKYAIVSWIDEVLVDAPWPEAEWWSNNVLEVELFNTRACYEQFYVGAKEASALTRRDALEVFYVCVVLGFRGLYRDPKMAAALIEEHGLPPGIDAWANQVAAAIQLGQGRPPLRRPRREIAGARPQTSRPLVVWSWLAVVILATLNIIYYTIAIARG